MQLNQRCEFITYSREPSCEFMHLKLNIPHNTIKPGIWFDLVSQGNFICEGLARALIKPRLRDFLTRVCARARNKCDSPFWIFLSERQVTQRLRLICAFCNTPHPLESRCKTINVWRIKNKKPHAE